MSPNSHGKDLLVRGAEILVCGEELLVRGKKVLVCGEEIREQLDSCGRAKRGRGEAAGGQVVGVVIGSEAGPRRTAGVLEGESVRVSLVHRAIASSPRLPRPQHITLVATVSAAAVASMAAVPWPPPQPWQQPSRSPTS